MNIKTAWSLQPIARYLTLYDVQIFFSWTCFASCFFTTCYHHICLSQTRGFFNSPRGSRKHRPTAFLELGAPRETSTVCCPTIFAILLYVVFPTFLCLVHKQQETSCCSNPNIFLKLLLCCRKNIQFYAEARRTLVWDCFFWHRHYDNGQPELTAEEQPQNELVIRIQPNEAIYYKAWIMWTTVASTAQRLSCEFGHFRFWTTNSQQTIATKKHKLNNSIQFNWVWPAVKRIWLAQTCFNPCILVLIVDGWHHFVFSSKLEHHGFEFWFDSYPTIRELLKKSWTTNII